MFIKILIIHMLFVFISGHKNVINMLTNYIVHEDKPTSVLIPNLCWSQNDLKNLARHLGNSNINIAYSLQGNRTEYFLHHIVVLADLTCVGSEKFLIKANADGYFKSPYRWILLNLGNNREKLVILNSLDILVDSDVVIAEIINEQDILLTEVYKIYEKAEVIYTIRAIWRPHVDDMKNIEYTTKKSNTSDAILSTQIPNKEVTTNKHPETIVTNYGVLQDYRQSKVLYYRRKNLRRHFLTMVNVVVDSNETRIHLDDRLNLHQDSITKMSYSVVKICFEMLNATERLIFTHTWGYRDKNGNWQGIVDHLLKKEADLGTLTIFTQERMEVVDYIAMVGSTAVRFVFREPPLSYISNIFALPFATSVWLAIFICIVGCSIFLYITSKWEATMSMHPLQLDGSWADVIILTISAVLQQGCTLEPRYAAGRCVTLLMFVALTILYAAYSANIVVLLRAPSSSVRTLPDLLNSPLKLGASDFEYNRYFFKKLNEPIRKAIYDKKIAPKGKKPNFYNMEEGVEKVRQGLFAFHMELNPGYRLIQETYREDEKCDLVEIDYINEIDPWVPGQKRSPFKDLFKTKFENSKEKQMKGQTYPLTLVDTLLHHLKTSKTIIRFIKIRESGIQANIHHRLHVPKPRCSGVVNTFSSVGITDMYPAILATLYGMMLAPLVLMFEIVYKKVLIIREKRKSIKPQFTTFLN